MSNANVSQNENQPQSPPSNGSDAFRLIFRLQLEIGVLEAELELKRRQLHRSTLIRAPVTQDEIQSIRDPSINADLVALVARAEEVKRVIASEFPEPVTCDYDYPENLQITINYPDQPSLIIDIQESLKANPSNVCNPLIAGAIAHYARQARRGVESTRSNLEKVLKALLQKHRPKKENLLLGIVTSMYLNALPEKYFDILWKILRSNEAVDFKLKKDKTPWLNHIETQIQAEYPEVNHAKVLNFLRDYPELIPPHCGGNPAGAFKNAILSSELMLQPDSVKTVRSSNPLFRLSKSPFSESDWEQMSDEYLADLAKMSTIKPFEDFSNLVIIEPDR